MSDPRIVPCEACGSEGRVYRGQDERDCGPCPACDGTGGEIVETEPVTLDDLRCPNCGASTSPMLFPCFEQGCPYPNAH
jgi:hypothetical protein